MIIDEIYRVLKTNGQLDSQHNDAFNQQGYCPQDSSNSFIYSAMQPNKDSVRLEDRRPSLSDLKDMKKKNKKCKCWALCD